MFWPLSCLYFTTTGRTCNALARPGLHSQVILFGFVPCKTMFAVKEKERTEQLATQIAGKFQAHFSHGFMVRLRLVQYSELGSWSKKQISDMNQLSVSTLTLHYGAETQSCILIKYQHDWLVINSTASNHVRQLKGASLKQTTAWKYLRKTIYQATKSCLLQNL